MTARREDIDNEDVRFMYEVEGMTQKEIGDYYGVSRITIYYRLHPDKQKERGKKWRLEHPEYNKEYHVEHFEEIKKTNEQYNLEHLEEIKEYKKEWWQTKKGKEARKLGFIPLNDHFEGGEWHHIDTEHVICMPKELHKSIWHNLKTGQGMEDINAISFRYITEETFDKLIAGEI